MRNPINRLFPQVPAPVVNRATIAACVFLLLIGVYVVDSLWMKHRRAAKERSERAFPIQQEDVIAMTLVTPDEIIAVEKQDDDRWVMTQPIDSPADKDAITVILSNLLPATRYGEFEMDETIDLADYGLDAPTYTLIVKTEDVPQGKKLLVGNQAAQSGKFYAKLDDEKKIFTINEYIKDKLKQEPFDLRDRSVLAVETDDVQRIELARSIQKIIEIKSVDDEGTTQTTTGSQRTSETIVIARTDEDAWRLEKPVVWKGDDIEIEDMLNKLKNAKVTSFIDQPATTPVEYGFGQPQVELTVEQTVEAGDDETTPTTGTQTLTLLIGDRQTSPSKDYHALRDDGTTVTVDRDLFDALAVKATQLRDKEIFALASVDVGSFALENEKGTVALRKNDAGDWVFADDAATSVDQDIVEDKVAALVNLRVKAFETDSPRDLADFGLAEPAMRLIASDEEHKTTEGLELGKTEPAGLDTIVFAKRTDRETVFRMDAQVLEDFDLAKDDFVDKSLFHFAIDDVGKIEVTKGAETTFTLAYADDQWKIQRAADEEPKRVPIFTAENLPRAILDLQYKDQYDELTLTEEEMGLSSPTLEVVVYNQDNAEIARVIRGAEKAERYYTRTRADGPICGIESAVFRALDDAIDDLLELD